MTRARRRSAVLFLVLASSSPGMPAVEETPAALAGGASDEDWDADLLYDDEDFPPVPMLEAQYGRLGSECREKCRGPFEAYVKAIREYDQADRAWAEAAERWLKARLGRAPESDSKALTERRDQATSRAVEAEKAAVRAARTYYRCLAACLFKAVSELLDESRARPQYFGLVLAVESAPGGGALPASYEPGRPRQLQAVPIAAGDLDDAPEGEEVWPEIKLPPMWIRPDSGPPGTPPAEPPRRPNPPQGPGRAPYRVASLAEFWPPLRDARPDQVRAALTSRGVSTGEAFDLEIAPRATPIRIRDEGLVVMPLGGRPSAGRPTEGLALRGAAVGYCLEYARPVPVRGTSYAVAPPEVQARFRPLLEVIRAAGRVAAAGAFHPDSDPPFYVHSITQWAVWCREQGLDESGFRRAFVEHTRKNAKAAGQKWSEPMERAVAAAVPGRWRDIASVLVEAKRFHEPRIP